MPTLRAAAELLAAADSIDALAPVAAAIGFPSAPSPLDDDALRALGVHDLILAARIVSGTGALRALLIFVPAGSALRDLLPRVATRLSANAPHVLWAVIATQPASGDVAIAAWSDDRRPPRVAALVSRRGRVVDSDAETVCALAAAHGDRDLLTHARWIEILSRESLTLRFYRSLEQSVDAIARSSTVGNRDARTELALLHTSRLLFLSFLEAKGWLDGDRAFLSHQFERCLTRGGGFERRVLRPLFFGTLNTPLARRASVARRFGRVPFLNGGLFSRAPLERTTHGVEFSDDAYGRLLFDLFGQYRFTAREESASWSEAAVDPEMLGRAFESLMGGAERRRTGAFFTPFALVERVTSAGLDAALGAALGAPHDRVALEQITVLDPACGSGAFLVHALERISALLAAAGDERGIDVIRRDVLTRSIFGVDVNPTAVWLCELRLWLSVVIESPATNPANVMPLPNLDRNVRVGDALAGGGIDADARDEGSSGTRRLRERYVRASGARKAALSRQLDRVERTQALDVIDAELARTARRRRDLIVARRGRDLFGGRYHPTRDERDAAMLLRRLSASLRASRRRIASGGALAFSFRVHFADVAARGGFSLVIGNPPWIRLHRIDPTDRAVFRRNFEAARLAAWEPGARSANAGRGFAAQVDVSALFTERAISLLAARGALALLLPAKLWRSLAGGGIRRIVARELRLRRLEDYSEASALFDAAVYPSLLVGTRTLPLDPLASPNSCVDIMVHHRRAGSLGWTAEGTGLAFDASAGAPWILLPPGPRRAFDLLRTVGTPFAESVAGRPYLGVKCGCNDAFLVRLDDVDGPLAEVTCADGRRATIERAMLRPVVRGEQLRPWFVQPSAEHIIWTHAPDGAVLPSLPPHAARVLGRWRRQLEGRTDARQCARWWSLFRTESAACDRPRVVWGDVGRTPRAVVMDAGVVVAPLNSCYVARCVDEVDAHAIAALLNGPLARAWLDALAEPARGGYRRFLGWTVSLLPLPGDWDRARDTLGPIGACAAREGNVSDVALLAAAVRAYDVDAADVASLLSWHG